MGKLLNTTYHDTINSITDLYSNLVNNPFYNWNDKKPVICTYYNINKDYSSLDPGSKIQYDNINDDSPIRYNRVFDFIIYGLDKIELNIDNGEFGLEADNIEGDAYILPNTIEPTEGDYFEINHVKDSTWLFIVKDVQRDTLQNGSNAYKISYKLEYDDNTQILNKIKHNYRMIDVREGTNFAKIVRCEDYDIAKIMDEKAVLLKSYFQELFYDEKVQTFIFSDLTEFRIYDPFMIEFLIRNKILNNGEDDFIYVDHKINVNKTFSIDYNKSFLRSIEKLDKNSLLASNHRISYEYIKQYGSVFDARYETYYQAIYRNEINKYNMFCISDNLIFRIIENRLINSQDDNKEIYDFFLWENVIIKAFNNEILDIDEINAIDTLIYRYKDIIDANIEVDEFTQFDSAVKVFYIIPILIYCLETAIEKVLK